VLASVAALSLLATRPWSSRNSFRQMRLFAPSARVENFRRMEEIFFARPIRRAPVPHRFDVKLEPLPRTFKFRGHDVVVDEFLERTVTTGLLVLHGNTIVTERYLRGASADAPLTSWSVAKSVVSLLVGIARAEDKLPELTTRLGDIVPNLRGAAYGKVTLRDALTMSS
jgi:CubicO group peptidase (beta-lactamase class C family)